jgi:hypothetical protein
MGTGDQSECLADRGPAFAFQPLGPTTSMLVHVTRIHGAIASAVLSTQLGVMHTAAAFSSKPGLMSRFIRESKKSDG